MMKIAEYLKTNKLICDGAFGTYYTSLCGDASLPERANLDNPESVKRIHRAYIRAGAGLIRTNTFAANRELLQSTAQEQEKNLRAALRLAQEARAEEPGKEEGCPSDAATQSADRPRRQVFIAGDIGPIPLRAGQAEQETVSQYLDMARILLDGGADCLLFETFSGYDSIRQVCRSIKKESDVFILWQFSVNQLGYTSAGLSAARIVTELAQEACVDVIGFNCGVGPGHMLRILEKLPAHGDKFLSALPNAGYPDRIQDRVVFRENIDYFSRKAAQLALLGADIVGGCCGTNPAYIKAAAERLELVQKAPQKMLPSMPGGHTGPVTDSAFYAKAADGGRSKLFAVELAPPFHADDGKVLEALRCLQNGQADAVTFPDSPSGRTRADSIMTAIKAAGHTDSCVMPHICCRDKNTIAIRAQLLGAYMNGIRNLLVVTGDPVPGVMRSDVRSVYNFDSVGLMRMLQEMNEEEFAADPFVYGGALSYGRRNPEVETERMRRKLEAGATFFLTQPVFTAEDAERLRMFHRQVPEARILCGIMPLVSRKNALFIQNEMAGIRVTDDIIERYGEDMTREQGEAVGIAIAQEMMKLTQDFAAGYYFSIPFNRVYLLDRIRHG